MHNFNKTTTQTIIAVLVVLLSFGFFYVVGIGASTATESTQTQITQGLFGIIMLVTGYYFGSSKDIQDKNKQ